MGKGGYHGGSTILRGYNIYKGSKYDVRPNLGASIRAETKAEARKFAKGTKEGAVNPLSIEDIADDIVKRIGKKSAALKAFNTFEEYQEAVNNHPASARRHGLSIYPLTVKNKVKE